MSARTAEISTPECRQAQRVTEERRRAYGASWPRHCPTCWGWGVVGSGFVDPENGLPDIDPCPDCSDAGICPRCAGRFPDTAACCASCKWGTAEDSDGVPPLAECLCWIREDLA